MPSVLAYPVPPALSSWLSLSSPPSSFYLCLYQGLSGSVLVCLCDPHPFPHPMPVQVSTPLALISQSGSMMKSWIQATFLCSLARHLRVLTFPWYG